MPSINLCVEMACPFYKSGASSGCRKYTVSQHCVGAQIKNVEANQYALYTLEGNVNGNIRILMEAAINYASK